MRTASIQALRRRGVGDGLLDRLFTSEPLRVTTVYEVWDFEDDTVAIGGTVAVDTADSFEVAGVGVSAGVSPGSHLEVPFRIENVPAGPASLALAGLLVTADLAAAEDFGGVLDDVADVEELQDMGQFLTGPEPVRATVGPVPLRLELPDEWFQWAWKREDGGFEPVDGAPVSIPLGEFSLSVSVDGSEVETVPASQLSLDPVLVAGTDLVIEVQNLHFGDADDLPADHDVAEDWQGVIFDSATIWGLDRELPFLDESGLEKLSLENWILGADGISGDLTVEFETDDPDSAVVTERVTITFDRTWWPVELEVVALAAPQAFVQDSGEEGESDEEADHDVRITAALRVDPHADDLDARWRFDVDLRRTDDGEELVALDGAALTGLGATAGAYSAMTLASDDAEPDPATLLLAGLAALDAADLAEWNELALTGASASLYRETVELGDGESRRLAFFEIGADLRVDATLALDDGAAGASGGEDDVPIEMGVEGVTATVAFGDLDGFDIPRLDVAWDVDDGLTVTKPANVDLGGVVTITDVTAGLSESALELALGVTTSGSGDVGVGPLPDVVVVTFEPKRSDLFEGEIHPDDVGISFQRRSQQLEMLVPGVLYAKGSLEHEDAGASNMPGQDGDDDWGDVLRGELRAFLVAQNTSPDALTDKDSYLFDLQIGLLSATNDEGLQAFVLTLDAGFDPGLPLANSGAALYGMGLTYAQNGRPRVEDGDYGEWYLDTEPTYSTTASKWEPKANDWGFGVSATLGSQPDGGDTWNVKAGLFLLLPGPAILITGEGDVFTLLDDLPDAGAAEGAFAAIIALDFLRNQFSLDLDVSLEVTAADGGPDLLDLDVPAHVYANLEDPREFNVAIGRPQPEDERVQADVLDLYTISSYLVVDGTDLALPTGPGGDGDTIDLPGVAFAFGGAGGLDEEIDAGPVALALWARAGFDVGVSLMVPLLAGMIWADGGIEASAAGISASMTVELNLLGLAPEPFMLAGDAHIELSMPWPIPDVDTDARIVFGQDELEWLEDGPDPTPPVESLTLWDRGSGDPLVLEPGDDATETVSLDVIPQLVFGAPVGNPDGSGGALALGDVTVNGHDEAGKVWEVATTGESEDGADQRLGYRHVVESVTVRDEAGETVPDLHALWPKHTESGNPPGFDGGDADGNVPPLTTGEQVARTSLLFDPLADPVEARIGSGAERTRTRLAPWNPCEVPEKGELCSDRLYTFRSQADRLERDWFCPPILDFEFPPFDDHEDGEDDQQRTFPGRVRERARRVRERARRVRERARRVRDRSRKDKRDGKRSRDGRRKRGRFSSKREKRSRRGRRKHDRSHGKRRKRGQSHGKRRMSERSRGKRRPWGRSRESRKRSRESRKRSRRYRRKRDRWWQTRRAGNDQPSRVLDPVLRTDPETIRGKRGDAGKRHWKRIDEDADQSGCLPILWGSDAGAVKIDAGEVVELPDEESGDTPPARVTVEQSPGDIDVLYRTTGMTVEPARLVVNPSDVSIDALPIDPDDPVVGLPRLVSPTATSPEFDDLGPLLAEFVGRVAVDFPVSDAAEVGLLCAPGVTPVVWAVGPDGVQRLLDPESATYVDVGGDAHRSRWRHVVFATDEPVVGLRLAAAHGRLDVEPRPSRLPAVASLAWIETERCDHDVVDAVRTSRESTAEIVGDLVDQRELWEDGVAAGVLEPDTTYELTVEGYSYRVKERNGRSLEPGRESDVDDEVEWSETFEFTTTDSPPGSLTAHPEDAVFADDGRLSEAGGIDDQWQVATSPADGARGHYLDDDLVVRLRDARLRAVFQAFNRDLVVRLEDDRGNVSVHGGEELFLAATDLLPTESALRDQLETADCLFPDGAGPPALWREVSIPFEDVLEPGRRYTASLHAVRFGKADGEPVHEWRFRSSRWGGFEEHVAAHTVKDEVVLDGADVLDAVAERSASSDVASDGTPAIDDGTLDGWLTETLRLPPRRAPADPEVVRIWAWDHEDGTDATPLALLFDGPEPLVRQAASAGDAEVTVESADGPVAVRALAGNARSRVLLVPEDGELPAGETITVTVTSRGVQAEVEIDVPDVPEVIPGGDA